MHLVVVEDLNHPSHAEEPFILHGTVTRTHTSHVSTRGTSRSPDCSFDHRHRQNHRLVAKKKPRDKLRSHRTWLHRNRSASIWNPPEWAPLSESIDIYIYICYNDLIQTFLLPFRVLKNPTSASPPPLQTPPTRVGGGTPFPSAPAPCTIRAQSSRSSSESSSTTCAERRGRGQAAHAGDAPSESPRSRVIVKCHSHPQFAASGFPKQMVARVACLYASVPKNGPGLFFWCTERSLPVGIQGNDIEDCWSFV